MADDTPDISEDPRAVKGSSNLQKQAYGLEFPGLSGSGKAWRTWIDARLKEQEPVMRDKRLHWRTAPPFQGWSPVDLFEGWTDMA